MDESWHELGYTSRDVERPAKWRGYRADLVLYDEVPPSKVLEVPGDPCASLILLGKGEQ